MRTLLNTTSVLKEKEIAWAETFSELFAEVAFRTEVLVDDSENYKVLIRFDSFCTYDFEKRFMNKEKALECFMNVIFLEKITDTDLFKLGFIKIHP